VLEVDPAFLSGEGDDHDHDHDHDGECGKDCGKDHKHTHAEGAAAGAGDGEAHGKKGKDEGKGKEQGHGKGKGKHSHTHDNAVTSIGFKFKGDMNQHALDNFIAKLMTTKGNDLFRYKGLLSIKGCDQRYVFQVRESCPFMLSCFSGASCTHTVVGASCVRAFT
jgi:G3E family GTPase